MQSFKNITCFIFDVDGVLSNGTVICLASGEQARTFLVKDGLAIERALKKGYKIAVITAGFQAGVKNRLEFLGIKDIFMNVSNKLEVFNTYLKEKNINPENVLYMGDDMPDIPVLKKVGIAACPANAADDVLRICHYISPKNGGEGAVRDVIEKVLKEKGDWDV
jgi:3-deoxy-D-manno-octulosonate 8-phosphate phosphatase (KDO 8-P phosphatase)